MPRTSSFSPVPRSLRNAFFSATLLAALAGCKSAPAPAASDDASLTSALNRQLSSDSSVSGQPIQGSVLNGVATLNGTVANDAQRTIAARDAAGIQGIRTVVNNLSVGAAPPVTSTALAPAPAPYPSDNRRYPAPVARPIPQPRQPAPVERHDTQTTRTTTTTTNTPINPPVATSQAPVAPAQPVFRNVVVPAGTTLPVRISQTLDSGTTQTGENFSGVVTSDIMVDGLVAIPQGSAVSGHVDEAQDAGHFSGNSLLTVSLTGVRSRGERLAVTSQPYSVQGKGRGKNTAEKAGVGAVGGAILGGIFGGGKGAAIGAAAGGATGAGVNAITRGQQVQIPSETVVRFHTTSSIPVRVRADGGTTYDRGTIPGLNAAPNNGDPTLQRRPN